MENQWYTAQEIAEALRVDVRTVRNYIRSGEIKATKIGKEYRINEMDLNDFIEKNSTIKKDGNENDN